MSHLKAGPIQFLSCNKSLFTGLFNALSESITSLYSMVFDCFLARFGRQKLFFRTKAIGAHRRADRGSSEMLQERSVVFRQFQIPKEGIQIRSIVVRELKNKDMAMGDMQ